jgi:hypothetical protein
VAYQAIVIPVMIASPGDVRAERETARDVIHEWTDVNSASRGVVLLPVGWETHSSPELAGRAQEIINQRILADCDLLVAIFWSRLGTPTGDAKSGSAEEIQRHHRAGKPVMVYFSAAPIVQATFDPDQYAALKEFKGWCADNGLIETFDDTKDFRVKFRRQLDIALTQTLYLIPSPADQNR